MRPDTVLQLQQRIAQLEQLNSQLHALHALTMGAAAADTKLKAQLREAAADGKAAAEAARAQLARSEEKQRAMSAELAKLKQEKELLLENMHRLIDINKALQDAVTAERAKQPKQQAKPQPREAAAAAEQEPRTTTPPQQQQQQQHEPRDQPHASSASRKRGAKAAAAGAGSARKRAKRPAAAAAAAAAAAGQEQAARTAEAAAAAAARARDYLQQQQQKQQQQQAEHQKAMDAQRQRLEARRQQQEAQRQRLEAERQRQAAAAAAAAAEAAAAQSSRPPVIEYAAPQPDLDSLSISGLKDFLRQADVDGCELRGLLEKGELLRCAKAHMQLWECRRLCACGALGRSKPALRLFGAASLFRVALLPGHDLAASVRAAREGLKRTRARLALLVHPDKAVGGLGRYKAVFDEAFRALEDAHATLTTDEAPQEQSAQQWAQQAQQAQQPGHAWHPSYAYAFRNGWAFPGYVPPGYPGYTAFNQGGARKG